MPRLTIAAMAQGSGTPVSEDSIRSLKFPTSPFYSVYVAGAKIKALTLEPQNIQSVLHGYTQLSPRLPIVQTKFWIGHTKMLWGHIGEGFRRGLQNTPLSPEPRHRRTTDDRQPSLKADLEESTEVIQALELALTESRSEGESLRDQLEQTRSEYASLRSELQLQDNMEQNKVVQSLKDLNREIENFGRGVAERLVDNHITYSETEVTTLQASNFPGLKTQFGHREGVSSLVCASDGTGMLAEDFLDLALRLILCQSLYKNIFLPFHPSLANGPENGSMIELYEKVGRRGKHFRV